MHTILRPRAPSSTPTSPVAAPPPPGLWRHGAKPWAAAIALAALAACGGGDSEGGAASSPAQAGSMASVAMPEEGAAAPVTNPLAPAAGGRERAAQAGATIAGPKIGALVFGGAIGDAALRAHYARFDMAVVNFSIGSKPADIQSWAADLKTRNPDLYLGQYTVLADVRAIFPELVATADGADAWLRTAAGARVASPNRADAFEINATAWGPALADGRTWAQYKADFDSAQSFAVAPQIDFVYTDTVWPQGASADWRRIGSNQLPGDAAVQAAQRAGYDAYWQALKSRHPTLQLGGNVNDAWLGSAEFKGKLDMALLNGMMGQSWATETRQGWPAMMARYRAALANAGGRKAVMFLANGAATDYATMRFGLASALLEDGYFGYGANAGSPAYPWYDEYSAPLGTAAEAPPAAATAGGVWMRRYSHGLVLVNPGAASATIDVGTGYKRLAGSQDAAVNDGTAITGPVTLGPRQGLLLLKSDDRPAVCTMPAVEGDAGGDMRPSLRRDEATNTQTLALRDLLVAGQGDVAFLGDSITLEWRSHPTVWDTLVPGKLKLNLGVGGDQIKHWAARIETGILRSVAPKAAVLMIGANDLTATADTPSPEVIGRGVAALADQLQCEWPDTRITVMATLPRGVPGAVMDPVQEPILIANALRADAELARVHAARAPRWQLINMSARYLLGDGTLDSSLFRDRLHLNVNGYQVWAQEVGPALNAAFAAPNSAPTVSLTAPAAGSTLGTGQAVEISATASDADGSVARVDFYDGDTLLGSDTSAPYSLAWTATTGSHSLSARAVDNLGATGASAAVAVTVQTPNVAPTVQIGAPADGSAATAGDTVTITATATDSDGSVARVEFFVDGTLVATDTSAPFAAAWAATAGSHSLRARAVDDQGAATDSAAVAINVAAPNAPPGVALASPAAGAAFTAGDTVTITATATDSDGSVARVEFYVDGALVATDASAPFAATWAATAGSHSLRARAVDDQGAATDSATVAVNVAAPNTPPGVTLASPAAGAAFTAGDTVTITATATDSDGSVARVEFIVNGAVVASDSAAPYAATWTAIAGSATLAARAVDDKGATTTSASITVTAIPPNVLPTVALTSPGANTSVEAGTSVTLAASAADVDGSVQRVDFYDGATLIGSDASAPYALAWVPALGSHALTARAVDDRGGVAASSAVSLTVVAANVAPAATLTSPAAGTHATIGEVLTLAATATDSDGSIARVEFYDGATLIGSDTTAPYAITWTATAGSHTLTARAYDNRGAAGSSAAATLATSAAGSGLMGQYFNSTSLGGLPSAQRIQALDYNWAAAAPISGVATNFSGRWEGWLVPPTTGAAQLQTVSDDGVRVWLDGTLVIDNWTNHSATTNTANVNLSAGVLHSLRVEYFDSGGDAVLRLQWRPAGSGTTATIPSSRLIAAAGRWHVCASQNQYCTVSGSYEVRYGGTGGYTATRVVNGGFWCTTTNFGNPGSGFTRRCEVRPVTR